MNNICQISVREFLSFDPIQIILNDLSKWQ